ncbi:uncharacterized protein LOC116664849 [Camelus ferus]|uniref:Uncharacterized protein LOC116664849 n=1 Tax=Camelus ferus TaxID=419612 RepID=A0A8B8TB42_CAMFR|nr:uncharacterized protein LOC116664849 [Camelus ferus]
MRSLSVFPLFQELRLFPRGPPLACPSVLLPVPVGKQIAPPPSTAFLPERGGRGGAGGTRPLPGAGRSPAPCSCALRLGGGVTRRLPAPGAPQLRTASRSTPGRRSAGGSQEDCRTVPPLLCVQTQLLVCSGGRNFARQQGGRILSDSDRVLASLSFEEDSVPWEPRRCSGWLSGSADFSLRAVIMDKISSLRCGFRCDGNALSFLKFPLLNRS